LIPLCCYRSMGSPANNRAVIKKISGINEKQ